MKGKHPSKLGLLAATLVLGCSEESPPTSSSQTDPGQAESAEPSVKTAEPGTTEAPEPKHAKVIRNALERAQAEQERLGGPIDWRQLEPWLPDEIGAFKATGEAAGQSRQIGDALTQSSATRSYSAGDKELRIQIGDTMAAGMLRAALDKGDEQSDDKSYRKTVEFEGHRALASFDREKAHSALYVLVDDRFAVRITIDETKDEGDATAVAKKLRLKGLTKLRGQGKTAAERATSAEPEKP